GQFVQHRSLNIAVELRDSSVDLAADVAAHVCEPSDIQIRLIMGVIFEPCITWRAAVIDWLQGIPIWNATRWYKIVYVYEMCFARYKANKRAHVCYELLKLLFVRWLATEASRPD